jgi:FtsP/CotA-like multicopper oxidase with cupredoxin domain
VTSPGGTQTVDILGFGVNIGDPSQVTLAGGATSTIKVPVGTDLTIHFTKSGSMANMPELSFPSLPAGSVHKLGDDYSFTTTTDMIGTSVFQPGSNADAPRQIAMGLVGVLVVTPTGCATCAYDPAVSYVDEAILATTDLDLAFALDYTSGAHHFSMGYFGQSPNPDGSPRKVYHLVNGTSFPDTTVIDVPAGQKVLLRYVNAGVTDKSMGLLGLRQTLLARNASRYTDPQTLIAPLVGPGETADVELSIPAAAPTGQFYSLMDQGRQMNHGNSSGFGGALTFLEVWPYVAPLPPGPLAPTQEGGLPGVPLAATSPGAPGPGIVGQEGGQPAPQPPPASPPPGPSGAPSEGGQPAQATPGP